MKGRDGAEGGREGGRRETGRWVSADQPSGEASWLQGVEPITWNMGHQASLERGSEGLEGLGSPLN